MGRNEDECDTDKIGKHEYHCRLVGHRSDTAQSSVKEGTEGDDLCSLGTGRNKTDLSVLAGKCDQSDSKCGDDTGGFCYLISP